MSLIEFDNVSFGYPEKDLYNEISFTIEPGDHVALIGSNGTGKSTLIKLLMDEEKYTYEGLIRHASDLTIGYVSQFIEHDASATSVFQFLAEPFEAMLKKSDELTTQMGTEENPEALYEEFQQLMDSIDSVDGYNYESNIQKQLAVAGLSAIAENHLDAISGGEYKLLYILRNMLLQPKLLIMDEPDVFLDFENIIGLAKLINNYEGTILTITHNRLLLKQCFNRILHIENMQLQDFDGNFEEYNRWLMETRVEVFETAQDFKDYIDAQQKLVEKIRKSAEFTSDPKKGRQLQARKKLVERMKTLKGEDPFLEIHDEAFDFPSVKSTDVDEFDADASDQADDDLKPEKDADGEVIWSLENYSLTYDRTILENVSFSIAKGDKIAIVGANGTGKSSMLRDIYEQMMDTELADKVGYFRQITENNPAKKLSGGERNKEQLRALCDSNCSILLLDEPTSHLDCYAQIALEKALQRYQGTVLLVSHDFFTITSCADRILILENGTLREMSGRAYRKSIYKNYFDSDIFENERKRIETETKVTSLIQKKRFDEAKALLGMNISK